MQDHSIPVIVIQLVRDMPRDVVVHLGEVLTDRQLVSSQVARRFVYRTATKKLEVPSARSKNPGKSFNHVSSPYKSIFPVFLAFICASHVSWEASDEDSSPSSMFSMTSRKDGIEPVVMALILGMVTVGDVACAVKGIAEPSRISLCGA